MDWIHVADDTPNYAVSYLIQEDENMKSYIYYTRKPIFRNNDSVIFPFIRFFVKNFNFQLE
jgi:hypothetical protein